MEEKDSLFRKESLEKVNSPEQLDKYLRVTTPSVWLVLCTIILILIGTFVWGYFGRLETRVAAVCEIKENSNNVTCYVADSSQDKIKVNQEIEINDVRIKVESIGKIVKSSELDDYISYSLELINGDYVLPIKSTGTFKPGFHKASVIVDSVSPLKFIFN